MARVECGNGHIYDPDQYATCPYCNPRRTSIEFRMPAAPAASAIGKTVAPDFAPAAAPIGHTVAPDDYMKANHTVAEFENKYNMLPVVGWLVCIHGADKGEAFTLRAKINTIGRGKDMDVVVNDPTVSQDKHARLAYDPRHNRFSLIPGESVNNIYLKDEPVYAPVTLSSYDLIEIGDSKFVFMAFCSDRFRWDMKQE